MRSISDIKWKFFKDREGNISNKALFNGERLCRTLADVYFELTIMGDGTLDIQVEEDQYVFYSRKLDKLYKSVYEKVYKYYKSNTPAFYIESTRTKGKIFEKVYSTVENINW